jgi:hypothetical protein
MLAATLASTVLTVAALFAALSPSRDAHAAPGGPVLELAQAAPAGVGPAFVDSFTVTCATTATAIAPAAPYSRSMISYACQTPAAAETAGTVLVAVGDSGIGDPTFATRTSPVYSGDTVREWGGNARTEYCRADTGTVTIFCRALISTATGAP